MRRRLGIILACVVLVPGVALAVSLLTEKQYTAASTLLLRDPQLDQKLFGTTFAPPVTNDAREVATNLKLVALSAVAVRTARALESKVTPGEVSSSIATSADPQANVVTIVATHPDPQLAAELANTFANEYIAFRREADRAKIVEATELVERQLDQLPPSESNGANERSLRRRLQELQILSSLQTGNAELVESAVPPVVASSPRPRRNTVIGLVLGILLGIGLAFLVERLDRRLRDPEAVREIFERPILTTIPESEELADATRPLPSGMAEPFRMLRANLRYFHVDRDVNSVLVTSAQPGDGKSTVAWNLARASASTGKRTLLIEADLRRPSLADWTHEATPVGLSQLLSQQGELAEAVRTVAATDTDGARGSHSIDVVFAGPLPPNPDELIESDRMRHVLDTAQREYDLVVIDTPPTSLVSDAVPLIKLVSGVLVVGRLGKTSKDAAAHLAQQLANLDARVLGVVVNGIPMRRYGYGYGYGYGPRADGPSVPPENGRPGTDRGSTLRKREPDTLRS